MGVGNYMPLALKGNNLDWDKERVDHEEEEEEGRGQEAVARPVPDE